MAKPKVTHRTCQVCKQKLPAYLRFYRPPKRGETKPVGVPPWGEGMCGTCAEAAYAEEANPDA